MSKTVGDYKELAERKGVMFVGKFPRTTEYKTTWKCSACGLIWETTYKILLQSKIGCPICARKTVAENQRLAREDYLGLSATRKDINWVEDQRIPWRIHDKSLWQCVACGNIWNTTYNNVKWSGVKCPKCSQFVNGQKASAIQIELGTQLGGQVNYRVLTRWLDIAFPKDRKAIELDIWYWHGGNEQKDAQRISELIAVGWSILAIKTQKTIPPMTDIMAALDRLNGYAEIVTSEWGHGKTFRNL